jgi:hypothetical protein
MKSDKDLNVLSLSFSNNRLAYAVFRHGQLDYYAGKTLRQFRTARSRNRGMLSILNLLVAVHKIDQIALPSLNKQQRRSSDLRTLYRTVFRYCLDRRLKLIVLDPVQMRRRLIGSARPTIANLRQRLIEFFPELKRYALTGSDWERRYYRHVFTGIGCGLIATDDDSDYEPERN